MRGVRRRGLGLWLAVGLWCFGLPWTSQAEPLARGDVPKPLAPWVDWVLRGSEDAACALANGRPDTRVCAFPARLELDLGQSFGRFRAELRLARADWAGLPGDETLWPQQVEVDGKPAVVISRSGRPSVWLGAGRHTLTGEFAYRALPEGLHVPRETALLALRVNGEAIAQPRRDPSGRVWLRAKLEAGGEEDRLDVSVSRRVLDSVPLELETLVELRVSGAVREVALGPVLPAGLVPLALDGPLPMRIDDDGRLRVQVRAGDWVVRVLARSLGPVEALARPEAAAPWPDAEVWAFEAQPSARLVEVEGVLAVDPQQTTLPDPWRQLPAYVVPRDGAMKLVEKRRGDADPAPDELALERTLWLDFEGTGYTFHDRISGRLSKSWRLAMSAPSELGRVSVDGVDQLIGRLGEATPPGVEVRQASARIEADGRIAGSPRQIPAVGWDEDFASVAASLNLPPGWRLFHASGVDRVSDTWIRSWSLLDLFLVLVIALAVGRLRGRVHGGVALLALVLIWNEPGAPGLVWLLLVALHALFRAIPEGRLRSVIGGARALALVLAIAISVPFAVAQVRAAVYPALEPLVAQQDFAPTMAAAVMDEAAEQAVELERSLGRASQVMPRARGGIAEELPAAAPASPPLRMKSSSYYAPEAGALVSTGPGLPSWTWRTVALAWSGPVERTQELRLWLVPPWANSALGWLRVALLIALLIAAGDFDDRAGRWLRGRRAPALALVLLAFVGASPEAARAEEFPPQALLDELRTRLLEAPSCAPECAQIPRMRLEVDPQRLRARLEISAAAHVAVPLPGGASDWSPDTVALDGSPAAGLARSRDGSLWLELQPGLHQVVMEGALPERETVELPLPLRPHRVEVQIQGWTLHGLQDDGRADASLQLSRLSRATGAPSNEFEKGEPPPFVRIERNLSLGILWQVTTRAVRMSPAGKALFLEVPLLAGESVTSAAVRVADGRAQVSFAPGATEVSWSSTLEQTGRIELVAPQSNLWMETWRIDASPVWHLEASGIPPIHAAAQGEVRTREFWPWPGEAVALDVARPEAVPGPTLTIDRAALHVAPGLRSSDATLTLSLRASRGAQHEVLLPEGAELTRVSIDGAEQPIRQLGRAVVLPIRPGSHQAELGWRAPDGVASLFRTPQIGVGAPAVNIELELALPQNRWILALGGTRLGPAVLFWSLLAVALLAALGLGRVRLTPLGSLEWLLLFVGLSQVPIAVAIGIAGWLLALGWRRDHPIRGDLGFDAVQVALALWTLLALAGLVFAIQQGLLGAPDMQIRGNGSTPELLRWYQDRSPAELPTAFALSVPLFVYRLAMLAWALWLAHALLGWLRFGWESFGTGGLWRPWTISRRRAQPPT